MKRMHPCIWLGWPAAVRSAAEFADVHRGLREGGLGKACSGLEILTALICSGHQWPGPASWPSAPLQGSGHRDGPASAGGHQAWPTDRNES